MRSSLVVHRGGWFHNLSELAADHLPEELLGHFVVDDGGPNVAPEAWPRHELSGWILRREASLPVLELEDADGEPVGWLLGHPVDVAAAAVVTGRRRVPARKDAPDFERRFQTWLYGHGGRFAAVLVAPRPRGYTDIFGALPLLFESRARRIASSPFLLVDPGELVPDSPLIAIIDPYRDRELLPVRRDRPPRREQAPALHELDLETFEQRRIWPAGPLPPIAPADAVELVGAIVEATIEAAARAGDVVMGMTGGGDSRMMLACSRRLTDDVELFTVPHADVTGQSDLATARMIGSSFGLRHRALRWVQGDEHDERRWLYRTGALAGDLRGRNSVPTYNQLATAGKRIRVSGIGVELARGYAWNRGLRRSEPPDSPTKRLLGRRPARAGVAAPEPGDRRGRPAVARACSRPGRARHDRPLRSRDDARRLGGADHVRQPRRVRDHDLPVRAPRDPRGDARPPTRLPRGRPAPPRRGRGPLARAGRKSRSIVSQQDHGGRQGTPRRPAAGRSSSPHPPPPAPAPSAPFRKSGALSDDRLGVRGKDAGRPDSGAIGPTEDAATDGETPSGMCRDLRNGALALASGTGSRASRPTASTRRARCAVRPAASFWSSRPAARRRGRTPRPGSPSEVAGRLVGSTTTGFDGALWLPAVVDGDDAVDTRGSAVEDGPRHGRVRHREQRAICERHPVLSTGPLLSVDLGQRRRSEPCGGARRGWQAWSAGSCRAGARTGPESTSGSRSSRSPPG